MSAAEPVTWSLIPTDDGAAADQISGTGDALVIGSADQADLQLPGPALLAEIHRESNGRFFLEVRDPAIPIQVNGEPVTPPTKRALLSGDELQIGEYGFVLDVRFPPRPQRSSLRLMSGVTAAILGITIISEVFLIGWLPARLSRQEVWGVDVARQKTLALADSLRKRSAPIPDDRPENAAARKLLSHALDQLAIQLREHGYSMDARQLTSCYDVLLQMEKRLTDLDDASLFPPPRELNAEQFLRRIIKDAPPPSE